MPKTETSLPLKASVMRMSRQLGKLSLPRLAFLNLERRASRTAGLVVLVAVLSFILFSGMILTVSLNRGLGSIGNRLGADLIVVPEGSGEALEGIMLQGEPNFFYLNKDVVQAVAQVEGVKQVSPQFFLTSVGADCCTMPVQIIGFDPQTDFTIQPWIREVYEGELRDGELIVGCDITAYADGTVRFYNETYRVASQLASTGTGLDQAVYGNWNTLISIYETALQRGLGNIPNRDPNASVSSVLIRVADGEDPLLVASRIAQAAEGVSVVRTQSMLSQIAKTLGQFSGFLYAFIALFALTALFTLGIVFSVTAGERKREFAILRTLGLTRGGLSRLLLMEAAFIGALGALAGTGLAALLVLPLSTSIGARLGLPYLQAGTGMILASAGVSILASLAIGPLAAFGTALRISRSETYLTLRDGE